MLYDALGLSTQLPRMAKDFLAETGSAQAAIAAYIRAVKTGAFPGPEHSFN